MNAGDANFDALTVSVRRAFAAGWSSHMNHTWSHSSDNADQDGAVIQSIFSSGLFRESSD